MKLKKKFLIPVLIIAIIAIVYYTLPVKRINLYSQLLMLGDLNNDNRWDVNDRIILKKFLSKPFEYNNIFVLRIDVNKNGCIDENDIQILNHLYKHSNPYTAQKVAHNKGRIFPRPREFFKYIPSSEYIQRPLFTLKCGITKKTPFPFINKVRTHNPSLYKDFIKAEIYNEALRFTFAYVKRKKLLAPIEKKYVKDKIKHCTRLYKRNDLYNLLLNIMGLVEDAETLTTKSQKPFILDLLYFRNSLKNLLTSDLYKNFEKGKKSHETILKKIEELLIKNLSININFISIEKPRNFKEIQNYIDRAEWQYYKSTSGKEELRKLLLYGQYDRRYLRAVSKTSKRHQDLLLVNHNLPMILLFREALRIKKGDKKAAVGILDEAIRIPFSWLKIIPRKNLPSSIALENFLLPGNKEDGSDKSRHWNVFGGLSLYKSPKESLILSIQREASDLKDNKYSVEGMTEFIRDTIANINGIYYVSSITPDM